MTRRLLIVASILACAVSTAVAEEPVNIKAEEMVFCTGITDWTPVGEAKTFPESVGSVYCFTRITGASEPTTVQHVWFYNDEEKARVTLNVKSSSWRTWSSKRILPAWTGRWRLEVLTADGRLLRSSEFLVGTGTQQE
jgi:hypothetical protein